MWNSGSKMSHSKPLCHKHLNDVKGIARLDHQADVSEEDLIALNKTISLLYVNASKTE
jgi:hypothetical protein